MEKWCLGIGLGMTVECVVSYEVGIHVTSLVTWQRIVQAYYYLCVYRAARLFGGGGGGVGEGEGG